ncbi:MAG: hypothetical protein JST54_16020 [Deltaproteobacteria bacterium]|nr:hypothetical protein [Deltaproteobacteria bacterium]
MRLAAVLLLLSTLALMAAAAYLHSDVWKLALYAATVAATLTLVVGLAAILEIFAEPNAAWIRALLALACAGAALAASFRVRPGELGDFPLRDEEMLHTLTSVASLGFALSAVLLGVSAVRLDKRGANVVGGVAVLVAAAALRGWLQHRT